MKRIEDYKWWQRININGTLTPGICDHGTDEGDFTTRWGFPESFEGKTVLDIGTYDGLFAFEAERRGANVHAIDIEQNPLNPDKAGEPFKLAKELLRSSVTYHKQDILTELWIYDIVLCFGVLYHMIDVFRGINKLAEITKEYCLIETACSNRHLDFPYFEVDPGYAGDYTNVSYPSYEGLKRMLIHAGFKEVEMLFQLDPNDPRTRITVKATK